MRLPVGKTKEELKEILSELSQQNNISNSGIRVTLTGGYSADGYSLAAPNLIITQKKLSISDDIPPAIKLVTYEHQRQLPDVKTIDYLMAIWLKPYITQHNADDVLYHTNGILSECPRSNIFIVTKDERIATPAVNILKGVNRNRILALASKNYAIEERDISIEDVLNAKEVFITSTTKQVLPVVEINGKKIAQGLSGTITLLLKKELQQLVYS
jgi:branched-chain amino acid aminotransferase